MMTRTLKIVSVALALASSPVLADDDAPKQESGNVFRRSGALLDRSPQRRPQMFSAFIGLPYGYFYYAGFPFGIGLRYQIPIVHDGFIPSVNDSFGIEFGLDFSGVAGALFYPILSIPVEVLWQFHMTKTLGLYVKLGIALQFNVVSYCPVGYYDRRGCGIITADGIGNVGLIWHFSQKVALRVEAGYPWFKVGLGFDI